MTLMINLSPEQETRLRQEAAKHGLEASEYALRLIEQHLPPQREASDSLWNTLTPDEWSRQTREWVRSHDTTIPLLPDEAVSRGSFYEGRP